MTVRMDWLVPAPRDDRREGSLVQHCVPRGEEKAVCGLRPRYKWALDLFSEVKCKRCLRMAAKTEASR